MSISAREANAAFSVRRLSAFYGEACALSDVSFSVGAGAVMSIIGANGAGKSTLMKSIVGMMSKGRATHIRGEIEFEGRRLERLKTEQIVDEGITMVPEGRRLFPRMNVEDNLLAGAYLPRCRPGLKDKLAEIYELFPRLAERRRQIVSQMSGGEQQMVAVGRALMSSPRMVLFDELSLGLAPAVVDDIYEKVALINGQGITCIVIEQDMRRALAVASHVCVMLEGRVVLQGAPKDLTEAQVTAAYFGSGHASGSGAR